MNESHVRCMNESHVRCVYACVRVRACVCVGETGECMCVGVCVWVCVCMNVCVGLCVRLYNTIQLSLALLTKFRSVY